MIRMFMFAAAAGLLLPPVAANACDADRTAPAASADLSAATKKKPVKKVALKKSKKPKVEYMRAVPM